MRLTAAVALLVLVAGCSQSTAQPPAPTPSASDSVAAKVAATAALGAIREKYPEYKTVPDEKIIAMLKANCASFDDGTTWLKAVQILTSTGMSGEEAGYIIGTSVYTMCLQHRDLLPGG